MCICSLLYLLVRIMAFIFLLFSLALQPSAGYGLLWLSIPARAMASSGTVAQSGLWPPLALHPSAGHGLLWHCSPARAMASSGSASQRGPWPPLALQPSAGYGLLWHCNPARAMASSGSAAQHGLWPPRLRGFVITQRRVTVGRTPLDERSARRRDP
jgi:hypothetical protein